MPDDISNGFISHIHEDDDGVQDLVELLANNGLQVRNGSITSDKPNNATNEEYIKREILAPRIRWAGVLIVYITADTKESWWVDWEIEYAHGIGKRIVGVWARGANNVEIPDALDKYRDALIGWDSGRIIDAIQGRINDSTDPDGDPMPERAIKRYACR